MQQCENVRGGYFFSLRCLLNNQFRLQSAKIKATVGPKLSRVSAVNTGLSPSEVVAMSTPLRAVNAPPCHVTRAQLRDAEVGSPVRR